MDSGRVILSFSKKIEKKSLQPSALRNTIKVDNGSDNKEVIESIEENVIKSIAQTKGELFIPLLERNWTALENLCDKQKIIPKPRPQIKPNSSSDDNHVLKQELTLDEQAEKELLEEATFERRKGKNKGVDAITLTASDSSITSKTTPSAIPCGKLPTLDDFEEVEVENFGAALLRGMGWNKSEGVGCAQMRKMVSPIEPVSRTLTGAAGRTTVANEPEAAGRAEAEVELPLLNGCHVLMHSRRHNACYGVVECVEEDHVMVRKAVGGEVVREVVADLTVVSAEQYRTNSRVINKELYDKFKNLAATRKNDNVNSDSGEELDNGHEKSSSSHDGKIKKLKTEVIEDKTLKRDDKLVHIRREIYSGNRITDDTSQPLNVIKDDRGNYTKSYSMSDDTKDKPVIRDRERLPREHDIKREDNHGAESSFPRNTSRKESGVLKQEQEYMERDVDLYYVPREIKSYRDSKHDIKTRNPDLKGSRSSRDTRISNSPSRKTQNLKKDYIASKYGDASANNKDNRKRLSQPRTDSRTAPWVQEGLTVRIINKNYKGGKHFKEKVLVEAVLTADSCQCRTTDGTPLRGLHPDDLETVIPKQAPRCVMVLKGPYAGQVGFVLELHKSEEKASVQLKEDESVICRLHYEHICQYNRYPKESHR